MKYKIYKKRGGNYNYDDRSYADNDISLVFIVAISPNGIVLYFIFPFREISTSSMDKIASILYMYIYMYVETIGFSIIDHRSRGKKSKKNWKLFKKMNHRSLQKLRDF